MRLPLASRAGGIEWLSSLARLCASTVGALGGGGGGVLQLDSANAVVRVSWCGGGAAPSHATAEDDEGWLGEGFTKPTGKGPAGKGPVGLHANGPALLLAPCMADAAAEGDGAAGSGCNSSIKWTHKGSDDIMY